MLNFIFNFITLIHGLIHFMGFAKAFGYGNFSQLTKEISKPMGIVWVATGLFFLICVLLYNFKQDIWVLFALIGIILSQILIINNWQDAKFGTIPNIIILIFLVPSFLKINIT